MSQAFIVAGMTVVMVGGAGGVGGAAGSPGRVVGVVSAGGVAGGGGAADGYRGVSVGGVAAQPVVIEAGMLYSVLAEHFPGHTPEQYGAAVRDLLGCVRRNIAESGGTSTTIGYRYDPDPADL